MISFFGSEVIQYPLQFLSTVDDFHEGSTNNLPTFLEVWAKVNVGLDHLKLNQQHLTLYILNLLENLPKVIALLKNTERRADDDKRVCQIRVEV